MKIIDLIKKTMEWSIKIFDWFLEYRDESHATDEMLDSCKEGDNRPVHGCDGKIGYESVENCSCHETMPFQCPSHAENPLVCLECGWEAPE